MKVLLLTLASMLTCVCGSCQTSARGEFAINSNGLMYNDADMSLLRRIVDSLDVKFKSCELNRKYYSQPQSKAISLKFESKSEDLSDIISDMKNGRSPAYLISTYKNLLTSVDSEKIIIRTDYKDKKGMPYFLQGSPVEGYEDWYYTKSKTTAKEWTYNFTPKGNYPPANILTGWYITEDMQQQEIPTEYSRLIQYVDCMIDTSSSILLADKNYSPRNSSPWDPATGSVERIMLVANYIRKQRDTALFSKESRYVFMSPKDIEYAKEKLRNDKTFITLLSATADECIKNNQGNEQLEELVAELVSKSKALLMKRSYQVVGQCSQDESPRLQALSIAKLAAEAHSWDIFLRAHLNIMNDRFERVTDGSYAYNRRKTYLKELEELDLNVVDLMLGLTLRAKELSDNHYYGTIWRIGWALTESKERGRFEKQALQMMKDQRLDEYNRGLLFILYISYLRRLDDVNEINQKIAQLKKDKAMFGPSLQNGIEELKEEVRTKKN